MENCKQDCKQDHPNNSFESATLLFVYYSLLPSGCIVKLNKGKFMWKLVQKLHPDCIQSLYHTTTSTDINNMM